MDSIVENPPAAMAAAPEPVTTIETRSDVDEIDKSFEIINKDDLELVKTDEMNNELVIAGTSKLTDVDATNNNTIIGNKPVTGRSISEQLPGDRKYSREELLQFKKTVGTYRPQISVDAILRPNNPLLDQALNANLALRATQRQNSNPKDPMLSLMPSFGQDRPPHRGYIKRDSKGGSRGSQQGSGSRSQSRDMVVIKMDAEVKLNEASNPFRPTHLLPSVELTEDEKKTHEIFKKFRSVLNKLTPENYNLLVTQQVKTLDLDTQERQEGCVKMVFEKAIAEPKFAEGYASLCNALGNSADKDSAPKLKNLLISACQREFEKHRDDPVFKNVSERLKEIETEEDPVKRDELKSKFEDESSKMRRRATGTVLFIGELYKINMLNSKIMMLCVKMLLNKDLVCEETLECLCKLLTTVGKKLEQLDERKVDLSEYFKTLQTIISKKAKLDISSRIRFMIQDLIELRTNNWQPRRSENKPKTMDQISKDAAIEQYTNQVLNSQPPQRKISKGQRDGNFSGGNMNQKRGGKPVTEDGWTTPSASKSRPLNFDMKKINISTNIDNTSTTLGQATLFQNFSSSGNRYNALLDESGMDAGKNSSRESLTDNTNDQRNNKYNYSGRYSGGQNQQQQQQQNRNSGNYGRGGGNGPGGRNNNRPTRSLQSPTQSNYNNKQYSSRQNNRQNSYQGQQQQQQQQQKPDLPMKAATLPRKFSGEYNKQQQEKPEKQITQDVKQVEAATIVDLDEVLTGIKKIIEKYSDSELTLNQAIHSMRVFKVTKEALFELFNICLDRNDKARQCWAELLTESIKESIVQLTDVVNALKEVFDLAADLLVDLPLIYHYLAQYLALPMYKGIFTMKDLQYAARTEIDANNGDTVLKETLKLLQQKYGQQSVCQLCSDLDFKLFLLEKDVDAFLKDNSLDYIKDSKVVTPVAVSDDQVFEHVKGLLKAKTEIDSIVAWIKSNAKSPKDNDFIRGFTSFILEICIVALAGSFKLNEPLLETLTPLLKAFIGGDENAELQCLYTIQKLIVKLEHPQGMLVSIFSRLYDDDVLSIESLQKWRDSDDPLEQEGKGVVLKSSTVFFNLIKEEEEEEDQNESSGE